MIDYDKFRKSLKHLEAQYANYHALTGDEPPLMQEAVAESVVQRFETCWDCLWKVVKRYLSEEIHLPEIPNGPNPVLRLANENRLLPSDIETWLIYAKARVGTSHDYDGEKASDAVRLMAQFIPDAIGLYERLSNLQWHAS